MKRLIVSLMLVLCVGVSAFAAGPLLNFGIEPTAGAAGSLGFGYDFDSWALIGAKSGFTTWEGPWSISALWTPNVGLVDVRVGPKLSLNMYSAAGWIDSVYHPAGLSYRDMSLVLGVEKFWGIVGAYGQLEFSATGAFKPVIGVELHFDLTPPGSVSNMGAVSNPSAVIVGK
jgi:hypothetical protein